MAAALGSPVQSTRLFVIAFIPAHQPENYQVHEQVMDLLVCMSPGQKLLTICLPSAYHDWCGDPFA